MRGKARDDPRDERSGQRDAFTDSITSIYFRRIEEKEFLKTLNSSTCLLTFINTPSTIDGDTMFV
jgi:hypothetical protein